MDTLKKRFFYHQPDEQTFHLQHALSHETFWFGVASGLDLFGQFRTTYHLYDPWEADSEALYGDWKAIGQDLDRCTRVYYLQHRTELPEQGRLFNPDDTTKAS